MAKGCAEPIKKEYLSVKEAEELTSRSAWTWRKDARAGKIASVKIGHQLLIPRSEIDRLMRENFRPAAEATVENTSGAAFGHPRGTKLPPASESGQGRQRASAR